MKSLLLAIVLAGVVGVGVADARNYEPMFKDGEKLTATKMNELGCKIQELQRKVEGMQKQITILHAKKVDVDVALSGFKSVEARIDKTRDQTSHITRMLDTRIDKVSDRLKKLEVPEPYIANPEDITLDYGIDWLQPAPLLIQPNLKLLRETEESRLYGGALPNAHLTNTVNSEL